MAQILFELQATDAALAKRWPNYEPVDREFIGVDLPKQPTPTPWSCLAVIQNILGADNVTDDEDELVPGMYYAYDSDTPLFRATGDTHDQAGSIQVPNLSSHSARDVGIAAHEAYHAWAHSKSRGNVYTNEKIINNLAEKWLRKHLVGLDLQVALEAIINSRVSYGKNHLSKPNVSRLERNG